MYSFISRILGSKPQITPPATPVKKKETKEDPPVLLTHSTPDLYATPPPSSRRINAFPGSRSTLTPSDLSDCTPHLLLPYHRQSNIQANRHNVDTAQSTQQLPSPAATPIPSISRRKTKGEPRPVVEDDEISFFSSGSTQEQQSHALNLFSPKDDLWDIDRYSEDGAGPKGFAPGIQLKPHQQEDLSRMLSQENSHVRGGINSIDMGLGKTIETIALMLTDLEENQKARAKDPSIKRLPPNLIVVPSKALIYQWSEEIEKFTATGVLKVLAWHGPARKKMSAVSLVHYDVVITTYASLRNDHAGKDTCVLYQTELRRVVLDEAHHIRNSETKGFAAVCELQAIYRWCLSGTPIQNVEEDLGSLCIFLRLPRSQRYLSSKVLRKTLLIRRLKEDVLPDLPPKKIIDIYCLLNSTEFHLQAHIKASIKVGFKQLIRTRQGCDHMYTLYAKAREDPCPPEMRILETVCVMCSEKIGRKIENVDGFCPDCHASFEENGFFEMSKTDESTKMALLKEVIGDIIALPGNQKTVVFSTFRTLLELAACFLQDDLGLKVARFDGTRTSRQRREALDDIRNDEETKVILITLQAGGEGLNLTACNHVILFDPWWNPKAEQQAYDRVHRIGQKRPVTVYRFIAPDTVEDRIVASQNRKMCIAKNRLGE